MEKFLIETCEECGEAALKQEIGEPVEHSHPTGDGVVLDESVVLLDGSEGDDTGFE